MIKVHVFRMPDVSPDVLSRVMSIVRLGSGPIEFIEAGKSSDIDADEIEWSDIWGLCGSLRDENSIPENEIVVVLLGRPEVGNYFGFFDENNAFIRTDDWYLYTSADPALPIAYELVANVVQSQMFKGLDDDRLESAVHGHPIGCMNDMCEWKPDVMLKLRTADICRDCVSFIPKELLEGGISGQITSVFENIRKKLLFHGRPEEFDDTYLPFPVAITRRRIPDSAGGRSRIDRLLTHFDAMVRLSVFYASGLMNEGDSIFVKDLSRTPTLGLWVLALKRIADDGSSAGLPAQVSSGFRGALKWINESSVVKIRNDYKHSPENEEKERLWCSALQRLIPILERCLSPVWKEADLRFVQGANKKKVVSNVLMGSHPDFKTATDSFAPENIKDIPDEGMIHLLSSDLRWSSIDHWMRFIKCPECNHKRVLVWDREESFLDFYEGHRGKI